MITNPVTPPSSHRHPVSSIALAVALGAVAEAVLVDDPVLDVALAVALPVPVALAEAVLVGAPFVELLAEAEELPVPVPLPLEDALVEEDVLVDAEPASARVETATIAGAGKRCFMGNLLLLTRLLRSVFCFTKRFKNGSCEGCSWPFFASVKLLSLSGICGGTVKAAGRNSANAWEPDRWSESKAIRPAQARAHDRGRRPRCASLVGQASIGKLGPKPPAPKIPRRRNGPKRSCLHDGGGEVSGAGGFWM